jgi:N-acetylglucosaminyl-diphospho-decaprenol L-rhamnosyltransferase
VTIGIVTPIFGRLDRLDVQLRWIGASLRPPDDHVVVWMGGPDPRPVVQARAPSCRVLRIHAEGPLPLARARNAGAATIDADTLVFLDVDCMPSPALLGEYLRWSPEGTVVAGPVGYLPASIQPDDAAPERCRWRTLARLGVHPDSRPRPACAPPRLEPRVELLWSLSMCVHRSTFERIGGFDESYVGYGGEDTDFAYRMQAARVPLRWCPTADAVHLYHEVSDPPVAHLVDIVHNAHRFRPRWGRWPMTTWLEAFADAGLVAWDPVGTRLEVLRHA